MPVTTATRPPAREVVHGGLRGPPCVGGGGGEGGGVQEQEAVVDPGEPTGGDQEGPVPALLRRDAVDAARARRAAPAPRPQLRPARAGAARRRGQRRVAGGLLVLVIQLQDVQVGEPGDGDYEKPVAGEQRRSVFAGGRVPRRVAGVVGRGQRRQPPRGSVHLQLP